MITTIGKFLASLTHTPRHAAPKVPYLVDPRAMEAIRTIRAYR